MLQKRLKLTQGDTRPLLIVTALDGRDKGRSITNVVPRMRLRMKGSETVKETLTGFLIPGLELANGSVNVAAPYNVPGAGGRMMFELSATACDTPGAMEGEVELTMADGGIQTFFKPVKFRVRSQFL